MELYASGQAWVGDTTGLLASLHLEWTDAVDLDEARRCVQVVLARADSVARRYPSFYGSEVQTLTALYMLVRLRAPSVVVETGVADGLSTEVILQALSKNGGGHLFSVDVSDDVGSVVTDTSRWTLHLVDERATLDSVLDSLRPVDLFYHDSDHQYLHQMAEYRSAWRNMRPGALLVSDDADWSYAFIDFCAELSLEPAFMFDGRKIVGFVQLRDR